MQNAEGRMKNCGTCGQQFISDLVYADFKSDTTDKRHPFILPQSKSQSDFASSLREGALYLPLEASSPKCSQCEMKRGDDGVAVKIHRRSKP